MKKFNIFNSLNHSALIIVLSCFIVSCGDSWFEKEPKNIITEENVWNDPDQILALLANFYDRMPSFAGFSGDMTIPAYLDNASWSGLGNGPNQYASFDYSFGRYYDYAFIRDINLALENIEKYSNLPDADRKEYAAEMRFVRAFVYFEMVKRMGGVPLITEPLVYDFNGDPSYLQNPRAKEADIYDFIASEVDAIKDILENANSATRANKYVALALKSRAMLYAGSLAKYNNLMAAPIKTSGEEVGIPASRANEYFQKSLDASKQIIESGKYRLYAENSDLGVNFYEMLVNETGNPEIIFAEDFNTSKKHYWTFNNIARGARESDNGASYVTPSLNFVEAFDYLDGTPGILKNKTSDGDYIYYDNISDIFANKDARLYGTVVYPGTQFRGVDVVLQAGVKVWDGSDYETIEGSAFGTYYSDGGVQVGTSGPHRTAELVSNTGFNLRKMVSEAPNASDQVTCSQNWWPWFRLGEIYLNAAEAAFELGQPDAKNYINTLRERAGFPPNSIETLTVDIVRNERRVELAFEDHRYFDLKRWRIAHELWTGDVNNPNDMMYALYPYRIVGGEHDGKYVFEKLIAPRFRDPRYFRMGNYYSSFATDVLTNNPKIVPNPFH
ncbi:MAG: RagB/SusD family nutrient uptake outer membrane protein [Tannerella sp.]|jgi:hypothetical protein|nr:RagB/SusD family nutrient uptake outer membrane protein [Tannerella sp.]